MKRACLVVLIGWLVPAPALASPCIVGSLASYVALGGGGCNIGTAQFFNFLDLPLQGGAFAIPDTALLVNPVRIDQVRDVAFAGEVLPQKSTDFYPKLLSGLAIYAME